MAAATGNGVWIDGLLTEDRLFVGEAPEPAVCVSQLRFYEAGLGFVSDPAITWHVTDAIGRCCQR
jgi:hypothetical protein